MLDYLLKAGGGQAVLARRELLKNALAHHLAERHDGTRSRYLFSEEPRHDATTCWVRIRCVEEGLTLPASIAKPGPDVAQFQAGERVTLRAWVALSSEESAAGSSVWQRRFAHHLRRLSSPLREATEGEISGEKSVGIARGKKVFGRRCARLRVSGCVEDTEGLLALLRCGIGDAKSYGFGLVDIEPAGHFTGVEQ